MLQYELTMDDHLAYNEWLVSLSQKQQSQKTSPLVQGILGVFFLALGAFLLLANLSFLTLFGFWFVFMGTVFMINGPLAPLLARATKQRWKEALEKDDSMKHYQGIRRIVFEADGLRAFGPSGERMIRWSAMTYAAIPTLDIFYVSPYDSIVIPRHAFGTEQQRQGFLAEIESRRMGTGAAPVPIPSVSGSWWTQGSAMVDDERQTNILRH